MSERKTYNKILGRMRLVAVWVIVAVLVWKARPTTLSVAVGAVFVAIGEAIRTWAAGHLFKTVELITAGPYRYSRNPLYLGRICIFTGLCVMVNLPYYGSWIALGVGYAVFFGYYLPRKERVEPARLKETHGEPYERYFRAIPALIPTMRPWTEPSPGRWAWERFARNREYWMIILLTAVTVFLAWRAQS